MKVNHISDALTLPESISRKQTPDGSFGDVLKEALNPVNDLHHKAEQMNTKMVLGEDIDLHQAMIATSKADLALQFTVQIRNKLVEAYQEVMRMQM
ncbi:flagellar hook-basal body complex protein FliE [Desulfitispora alkaliphila]|uniref:flagellar hook-basal body complex protein FliE n=1 Tax=Desulfitispora alkaliphila TaxID=622674 RepID=UPI003D24AD72